MLDPNDERLWSSSGFAPRTRAGVDVNEETALVEYAVVRCSRLLTETPSGLPIRCHRFDAKTGDRITVTAAEVPALALLSVAPNPDMTAGVFREGRMLGQINWGNGFAEIVRDQLGRVAALWPLQPSRVSPSKTPGYAYDVKRKDGVDPDRFRREDMLHVCGMFSVDGIWGRGVVTHARENIGASLAVQRHGSAYFGSGAQPKGIVVAPGLKKPEQRDQFKREWKEIHGSPDSSEVVIIPDGSYSPITISNQDNQFIETGVRNQEIICHIYGVPLYMMGAKVVGSTVEALSMEFVLYGLYPWMSKFEQQCNFKLLDRSQWGTYFFEHDLTALLRGDIKARLDAYRVGITTGVFTINEVRRFENLPGIGPAGEVHYVPANMFTADQMMNGNPGTGASGPGSDHSGAPADSPLDRPVTPADPQRGSQSSYDPERAFEMWRRELPKLVGDELGTQMKSLERQLENRPHEWREVARSALHDVLARTFTKESNAAARAAKGNGDFDRWVKEFYAKHEPELADHLGTACKSLTLAGVKKWEQPGDLAAWLVARSTESLKHAYDHDTPEVFARRLGDWPTKRAADVAEEILKG